jgi:hypothetical protein
VCKETETKTSCQQKKFRGWVNGKSTKDPDLVSPRKAIKNRGMMEQQQQQQQQ